MKKTLLVWLGATSLCVAQSPEIIWQKIFTGGDAMPWTIEKTPDGGFMLGGRDTATDSNGDAWISKIDSEGNEQWAVSFGGDFNDYVTGIELTSDGGCIVACFTTSQDGDVAQSYGGGDLWILKLDSQGTLEWQKTLGGSDEDFAGHLRQCPDGGYVIAGYTKSNDGDVEENYGLNDAWVVKLTADGNLLWETTIGGEQGDASFDVALSPDGGCVVTGINGAIDENGGHVMVAKLNSNGDIIWNKDYGNSLTFGFSLDSTSDGGYIIGCETSAVGGDVSVFYGIADYWIAKIDGDGNLQWEKTFGGPGMDMEPDIAATTDGGFLIAGKSSSESGDITNPLGNMDYWIVKTDANGTLEWQKSLGGSALDVPWHIVNDPEGNYIIAGNTASTDGDVIGGDGNSNFWVVELEAPTAGIEEVGVASAVLYPVPATDFLSINTEFTAGNFIITDMTGKKVLEGPLAERIDISSLATGTYSISINGTASKFIKK